MAGPWIDLDLNTAVFYIRNGSPTGEVVGGRIVAPAGFTAPLAYSFPPLVIGGGLDPTKHYDIEITFDPATSNGYAYIDLIPSMDQAGYDASYQVQVESPGNFYLGSVTSRSFVVGPGQNSWDYARYLGSNVFRFFTPNANAVTAVRYRESDYVAPVYPASDTTGGETWGTAGQAVLNGDTDYQLLRDNKAADPGSYPYWGLWWTFASPVDGEVVLTPLRKTSIINNYPDVAIYAYSGTETGQVSLGNNYNSRSLTVQVRKDVTYHVQVGSQDYPSDVMAVGLRTQFYTYEYTDWMQDANIKKTMNWDDRNAVITGPIYKNSTYSDPGTPTSPPGDPNRVRAMLAEVSAGPPDATSPASSYDFLLDKVGGALGGPTNYYATGAWNVRSMSARGIRGYAPAVPPGYLGYEFEDPARKSNPLQPIALRWTSGMFQGNRVNFANGDWITRFSAVVPDSWERLPGWYIDQPAYDMSHGLGTPVLDLPASAQPAAYGLVTFDVDLTPFLPDSWSPGSDGDGDVLIIHHDDLTVPPDPITLNDGSNIQYGLGWSATTAGVEYTFRPPKYRLITAKTPWEPPKPKSGWIVGGMEA